MSGRITVFYGPVITPVSLEKYNAFPRCLLAVGPTGNIEWIVDDVPAHEILTTLAHRGCVDDDVLPLKQGEFLMPGFIDTHTHAPQVPNMGTGQQYQLLDWLEHVTFPMEARFADSNFASQTYEAVVRRYIENGTTTCCYYGTLHLPGTRILADTIHALGQRALVGKCNMNRNCPKTYIEPSTEASLDSTSQFIAHVNRLPRAPSVHAASGTAQPLVQPVLTPRFAISCTPDLLNALGALASTHEGLRIQTHIAENKAEVAFTKELFPEAESYAGVYDSAGLLGERTILAHAVHLDDGEMKLVKARQAGISHCPTSNFNLTSGVAPVGKFLDMGIKVGLGTDVSGGFSQSMLNAIQHASIGSKILSMQAETASHKTSVPPLVSSGAKDTSSTKKYENKPLSISALLYLATLGGAEVCGLRPHVGTLMPGASFDALLVSVREDAGATARWWDSEGEVGKQRLDEMLERFLFCGDDRNIRRVFVQGRVIGGKEFS